MCAVLEPTHFKPIAIIIQKRPVCEEVISKRNKYCEYPGIYVLQLFISTTEAVSVLKIIFPSILLALVVALAPFLHAQTWDAVKSQIVPEDVAERPPEVPHVDDYERDTFNRENFYNKSAGTRQYRRSMMAPTKSMDFDVVNPAELESKDEGPTPKAQVVEKNGKAVTVISIGEDSESEE